MLMVEPNLHRNLEGYLQYMSEQAWERLVTAEVPHGVREWYSSVAR